MREMHTIVIRLWHGILKPHKIQDSIRFHFYRALGARKLADYLYRREFGRPMNWQSPRDLNEWINWLSFYTDTTGWSRLADKLAVRRYVAGKGFADILIPLLKTWDKPDDLLSFDNLPDRFVLKMNNGSGDAVMVTDKSSADINAIRRHFRNLFSHPFGIDTAEPHYLRIAPKILAEEMLDPEKQPVKSSSLIDYKFWCFNGMVFWCFVVKDRTKSAMSRDLYLCDRGEWERCDKYLNFSSEHLRSEEPMPLPQNQSYMLEICRKLSDGFPQMRVDLYEVGGKVWFGECTMTSYSGRMTSFHQEGLRMMGDLCAEAYKELISKNQSKYE